MKKYIGLGKTLHNSSVGVISGQESPEITIYLSERYDRIKNSGAWPVSILKNQLLHDTECKIVENSAVTLPEVREKILNENLPFFEHLKQNGVEKFSKHFNNKIKTIGHHLAHAYAAAIRSPFEECLIAVIDGAGSSSEDLQLLEEYFSPLKKNFEHFSLYSFKQGQITCLEKELFEFKRSSKVDANFSNSIGIFYEMVSKYIFNTKNESGKVMGLASFGEGQTQGDYFQFLENLDWNLSFKGKSKAEWEQKDFNSFANIAANAQATFEDFYIKKFENISTKYPQYNNIILTGGCSLNCTANGKLLHKKFFDKIYVTPFPGDESIGLGCAAYEWFQENNEKWIPTPWENQVSFLGSKESIPTDSEIEEIFEGYQLSKVSNIAELVADELSQNKVIAWFQGQSETGPRALGHRSILARPDRPDLKNYLNQNIKFRESFRPYGCTVTWEDADIYFDVPKGMENPFMSFAVPVRDDFKDLLKHVIHIDGTSRMQTLHVEQEPLYYELLQVLKKKIGLPIVLNTSLNVMNEPILETVSDALRFFQTSAVDGIAIGNYYIRK